MSAFTPLYETDADEIAPKLASADITAGVYVWLLSRAYSSGNATRISQGFIAETLGVSRRAVVDALKRLEACGAVTVSGKRGRGGGSVFSISLPSLSDADNVRNPVHYDDDSKCAESCTINVAKCAVVAATNVRNPAHDKEEELKEDKPSFSPNDETAPVLSRLNELTGKTFGASDAQPIRAAMQSGLGVGECIRAVEHCCASFSDEYRAFLTPRTIFKPAKARGYARAWREGDGAAAERRRESESFDWSIYD